MAELRWSILAVGLIIAATMVAFTFRYQPLTYQNEPLTLTYVWDRWKVRTCMTGMGTDYKMICTRNEMEQFGQNKH